jgi:hypothetical protein
MNGTPQEIFGRVDELAALKLRVPAAAELAKVLGSEYGLWKGVVPITTEPAVKAINELLGANRG